MNPEYKYIFSDLAFTAKTLLSWKWRKGIYPDVLDNKRGWYIDDRASPDEFWALMALAHPNETATMRKVNKTLLKRGIDYIFTIENIQIIRNIQAYYREEAEYMAERDAIKQKEEDEENYSDHIVYLADDRDDDGEDLPEGILYKLKIGGEMSEEDFRKVIQETKHRFL